PGGLAGRRPSAHPAAVRAAGAGRLRAGQDVAAVRGDAAAGELPPHADGREGRAAAGRAVWRARLDHPRPVAGMAQPGHGLRAADRVARHARRGRGAPAVPAGGGAVGAARPGGPGAYRRRWVPRIQAGDRDQPRVRLAEGAGAGGDRVMRDTVGTPHRQPPVRGGQRPAGEPGPAGGPAPVGGPGPAGTGPGGGQPWPRSLLRRCWPPALIILAGLGLWELIVRLAHVPGYLLPAPSAIAADLAADWPVLEPALLVTVQEVLLRVVIAAAARVGPALALHPLP